MRRILLILAIAIPILALTSPAKAGGWAVTYLDPVPATFQPGISYTIGSWLLQHGNHPYWGKDSELKVGLKFTDGKRTLEFGAVKLKEPAHYATAVALPKGTWQVTGVQEWFAPFDLGTLTVPGALKVKPPDSNMKQQAASYLSGNNGKDPWGAIRPPGLGNAPVAPVAAAAAAPSVADPGPTVAAAAPSVAPAADSAAIPVADSWWRQPYAIVAAVIVAGGLALLGVRRRRQSV